MAGLIKPYLYYNPTIVADIDSLLTRYCVGRDIDFTGDTLTLSFSGNRVDVLTATSGFSEADSARILLDGKKPSEFQGCYFTTRPYNSSGTSWPWELSGMIRVQHTAPWVNEEWTCIFKEAEEPYSDFSFSISGSVTGYDGTGKASLDFISDSKKIIIKAGDAEEGGDWHLKRSFKVLKTRVNPGDTIQWMTYSVCTDLYIPGQMTQQSVENVTTLFQGVENTRHTLQIIRSGESKPPIKEIRVYRPFWNRL